MYTVVCLCTRLSKSDGGDWKNLRFLTRFAKSTINDKLIIWVNGMNDLCIWVDASYTVHEDMCIHTGGEMLMGVVTLHIK